MEQRFFVTIFAADQTALKGLTRLDLDLFGTSSPKRGEASVGGLLTEAQIKQVEKAGYRVKVHEEYVEQSRMSGMDAQQHSVEVMDDEQWLKAFYDRKKVK
jgi:hypothetical protein